MLQITCVCQIATMIIVYMCNILFARALSSPVADLKILYRFDNHSVFTSVYVKKKFFIIYTFMMLKRNRTY